MTASDTFQQTRHRCLGCRRSWASASRLREHQSEGCLRDPAVRGCRTCVHYREGYPSAGRENPGADPACRALIKVQGAGDVGYVRNCAAWAEK